MSATPPADPVRPRGKFAVLAERLLGPKVIVGLIIIALALWFVFTNNSEVRIHLWLGWVTARLWVVLICTFAAGVITGLLMRRRRPKPHR
jgi:hypothetical protein